MRNWSLRNGTRQCIRLGPCDPGGRGSRLPVLEPRPPGLPVPPAANPGAGPCDPKVTPQPALFRATLHPKFSRKRRIKRRHVDHSTANVLELSCSAVGFSIRCVLAMKMTYTKIFSSQASFSHPFLGKKNALAEAPRPVARANVRFHWGWQWTKEPRLCHRVSGDGVRLVFTPLITTLLWLDG